MSMLQQVCVTISSPSRFTASGRSGNMAGLTGQISTCGEYNMCHKWHTLIITNTYYFACCRFLERPFAVLKIYPQIGTFLSRPSSLLCCVSINTAFDE